MQLSARNQLNGTIKDVTEGAVNGIVTLEMPCGQIVSATISMSAIKELNLFPGKKAVAVIKATDVMVGLGPLKLSARNQLDVEITAVTEGAVNGIVSMTMACGQKLSATISIAAINELELAANAKAKAVIKSTSVMIGV